MAKYYVNVHGIDTILGNNTGSIFNQDFKRKAKAERYAASYPAKAKALGMTVGTQVLKK